MGNDERRPESSMKKHHIQIQRPEVVASHPSLKRRTVMRTRWSWSVLLLCLILVAVSGCQKTAEDTTAETADAVELEFWKSVKDSEHPEDLRAYLERYPEGAFAGLAESKLSRLTADQPQGDVAPPTPPASASPPPPSAAAATPPAPSPPPPRPSRRQMVMRVIDRELAGFTEPRLHVAPNIPRFKLENVASLHGLRTSDILLLYDDGISKGGKTGFCLTEKRVHWRFVSGSPPLSAGLEDVRIQVRKKKFLINGQDVSVTMSANPRWSAQVFGELLEKIRDELR